VKNYSEKSEMYDWITASFDISKTPRQRYVSKIIQISEVKNFFTNTTWANGYLFNTETGRKMGVSISDKRIKLKICPNKYVLGNNVESAPIGKVEQTLQGISDTLGIDIKRFKLEKVDVTNTALTEFVPEMYFPYLCNKKGSQRWIKNTSLYYDANSSKVVNVFYDKVKEVNKSGVKSWGGKQKIPAELKGQNLTRFECRLGSNSEIRKVVGGFGQLHQLFTEEHIFQLHNWWLNQYEAIPKQTEINYKFTTKMGARNVLKTINNIGKMRLGKLEVENLIELASKQGAISPSEKTYVKKKALEIFDNGKKHTIINELDEKYKIIEPEW